MLFFLCVEQNSVVIPSQSALDLSLCFNFTDIIGIEHFDVLRFKAVTTVNRCDHRVDVNKNVLKNEVREHGPDGFYTRTIQQG